jgi:N-acetylglutamate synthase-like GNAT family acetyltransferase
LLGQGNHAGYNFETIDNSFCFGVYRSRNQIGFARVITDYADVFIDPNEQQKGYGKRLLRHIFDCKDLQGLRRWHLITADATLFYQDQGFSEVSVSKGHMELRIRPDYLEARC